MYRLVILLLLASPSLLHAQPAGPAIPDGMVLLKDIAPSIVQEMRYATDDNFVGRPVHGYEAGRCYLSRPAAEGLARAQQEALAFGLTLKVFDCYRPQRAVNHFIRWASDASDTLMKHIYYPEVPKNRLFEEGYIASRSGHSRGSTVDLTLIPVEERSMPAADGSPCDAADVSRRNQPLDMGTDYDCFSERSHTETSDLASTHRANRLLLRTLLERQNFRNYWKEWWHFTLRNEPFPDSYFDFIVR